MPRTNSTLVADSAPSPIPSSTPKIDSDRDSEAMIQNQSFERAFGLNCEPLLTTASQASEFMVDPDSESVADSAPSPIPHSG